MALVKTLDTGEALRIGQAEVRLIKAHRGRATLCITAPRHIAVSEVGPGPHRALVPLPDGTAGADAAAVPLTRPARAA